MASPLVRAAWRVRYRARKQGKPLPDETRRIINEYFRPGARKYQRQKRAGYRHIPPSLFQALLDRGISAILINKHSNDFMQPSRYLIVGTIVKNGRKMLAIDYASTRPALIGIVSAVPYPAIVIDTKEIH